VDCSSADRVAVAWVPEGSDLLVSPASSFLSRFRARSLFLGSVPLTN
jgi:hypothetical protein